MCVAYNSDEGAIVVCSVTFVVDHAKNSQPSSEQSGVGPSGKVIPAPPTVSEISACVELPVPVLNETVYLGISVNVAETVTLEAGMVNVLFSTSTIPLVAFVTVIASNLYPASGFTVNLTVSPSAALLLSATIVPFWISLEMVMV